MIIYIYGEDTFRSRQYLKQMVEQFKKTRDPQGYNVVFLDGKKDEARLAGELMTAPFLAEKRMIVIENALSGAGKEVLAQLEAKVKENKIPECNIAVFWQSDPVGKTKEAKNLAGLLAKEKYAQEFSLLTGAKLEQWADQEFAKRGGKINRRALIFLCDNAGKDMWHLNSLIDQLVAYKKGEEIQLADVQSFVEEKIDDNVFSMVDAIVSGNRKMAYRLLNEQRRLGEEEGKLFGLIAWQFRILILMRDLFEREDNLSSDALAKKLGIHPFVAKKNMAIVKRNPLSKLRDLHSRLLDIDFKTKTGLGDQSMLLDLFVGKIS